VGTVINYLYTAGSLLYLANTICQFLLAQLYDTHAHSLAARPISYWSVCSVIWYPLCTFHMIRKKLPRSKTEFCEPFPLYSACWKNRPHTCSV